MKIIRTYICPKYSHIVKVYETKKLTKRELERTASFSRHVGKQNGFGVRR